MKYVFVYSSGKLGMDLKRVSLMSGCSRQDLKGYNAITAVLPDSKVIALFSL